MPTSSRAPPPRTESVGDGFPVPGPLHLGRSKVSPYNLAPTCVCLSLWERWHGKAVTERA